MPNHTHKKYDPSSYFQIDFEYKLLKLSVENLGELKEWHKKLKDMTKQLGQQIKAMEPKVEK